MYTVVKRYYITYYVIILIDLVSTCLETGKCLKAVVGRSVLVVQLKTVNPLQLLGLYQVAN